MLGGKEALAVGGTFVDLSDFVVQFVGLRGMHWSASIAQLIAIAIMIALRASVRRNLAELPKSQPFLPGHEMDWLAMTLRGNTTKVPYLDPSKVDASRNSRRWADDDD